MFVWVIRWNQSGSHLRSLYHSVGTLNRPGQMKSGGVGDAYNSDSGGISKHSWLGFS